MARDSILNEIAGEVRVRIAGWRRERDELLKAAERVAELDDMIEGAEAELDALYKRKPALRPVQPKPERAP